MWKTKPRAIAALTGRFTLGLRPYSPSICDGMRMLPPMSVPQPTTEPRKASSVPSPPVEPPGVKSVFLGCVVRPNRGFSVSHHYRRSVSTRSKEASRNGCRAKHVVTKREFTLHPRDMPRQFTHHDTLRQVRFGDDDSAHSPQERYQNTILLCRLECSPNVPERTVVPANIKLILQRHGHTMQRPHKASMFSEKAIQLTGLSQCIVKKYLSEAGNFSEVPSRNLVHCHH